MTNSLILTRLVYWASVRPNAIALADDHSQLNYGQLWQQVLQCSDWLQQQNVNCLAILADNTLAWAIIDLAALHAQICCIPLPHFFSDQQLLHILSDAKVELLLQDKTMGRAQLTLNSNKLAAPEILPNIYAYRFQCNNKLPSNIAKITYTSGTTGSPKGVCLDQQSLDQVSASLFSSAETLGIARHLCVMPLATLLENLSGIYVPLIGGVPSRLTALAELGLADMGNFDAPRFFAVLQQRKPESLVLAPQLLMALSAGIEFGLVTEQNFKFIAVGGGHLSALLEHKCQQLELPVYQGYGLSECASVVSLNQPGACKPGSVGKPMPGLQVKIDQANRIWVKGRNMLGYLGQQALPANSFLDTGDTGYLDDDGYLFIDGRTKNILITSLGRNISPEWVESQFTQDLNIAQAYVFGEGKPYLGALFTPRDPATDDEAVQKVVEQINQQLPQHAQIKIWQRSDEAFSLKNGFCTQNGRLKRQQINSHYFNQIENLYSNSL